ncbi:MAG: SIS domain-containing protein [Chloroflexota bacterium]|nr:SIS domain-containing protein [Chloroflexota bacterium]
MDAPFPTTDSRMYVTLHRQPADVQHLLDSGWEHARAAAEIIAGSRRIWITGIGTSYHAALQGGWFLRSAGKDARAVTSFDFATYPNQFPLGPDDAVIVQAHTGVKSYSKLALDRAVAAGVPVISIGSETAEHPGSRYILRTCERETSAAYTSSHLCAMVRLAQLATELGNETLRMPLAELPANVQAVIDTQADIKSAAQRAAKKHIYAIGAGPNEPVALEFVIKAREAALHQCDGLGLEQFFHGPIVAVGEGDFAIVLTDAGASQRRADAVATGLAEIGCEVWSVGNVDPAVPGASHFPVPITHELLAPLVNVVAIQLFAYFLAETNGTHPDRFRREDPVYADAFGLLTL